MDLTYFYVTLALMLVSGGLGYYAGGRKLAGMKIDIDNTKSEIEKVKSLVRPQKVTVINSGADTKAPNTGTVTVTPGI